MTWAVAQPLWASAFLENTKEDPGLTYRPASLLRKDLGLRALKKALSLQQRKESKKPPAKLQPRERELEGWLRPEDENPEEGAEDELEIRVGLSVVLCFCGREGDEGRGRQGVMA